MHDLFQHHARHEIATISLVRVPTFHDPTRLKRLEQHQVLGSKPHNTQILTRSEMPP